MTAEYAAIALHYGDRRARRSGVLLMHHIDEGLAILAARGASERARRAFCIHPLVQDDAAFVASFAAGAPITDDPWVMALAIEYRRVANAALSTRALASTADIALSPIADVNEMLVADKLQNQKDFALHHRATHPRSAEAERYFALWLERLGVSSRP